jgi:hypothetical protein
MKKLLFALAIAGIFVSCNNEAKIKEQHIKDSLAQDSIMRHQKDSIAAIAAKAKADSLAAAVEKAKQDSIAAADKKGGKKKAVKK